MVFGGQRKISGWVVFLLLLLRSKKGMLGIHIGHVCNRQMVLVMVRWLEGEKRQR